MAVTARERTEMQTMAEYIEREALKNDIAKSTEPFNTGSVFRAINRQIAADVAPVVRCNDCKHLCVWNRKDIYAFCPKTNIVFLPFEKDTRTFFCSLGERKDGGNG